MFFFSFPLPDWSERSSSNHFIIIHDIDGRLRNDRTSRRGRKGFSLKNERPSQKGNERFFFVLSDPMGRKGILFYMTGLVGEVGEFVGMVF